MMYVFGDCILDTQLYVLRRAGREVRLRPKVFQVLMYLIMSRERVVPRSELCAHVWPGQFVSDTTLESTMRAVRQALGDTGRNQSTIRTLIGHGYRFIAEVTEVDPTPTKSPPEVMSPIAPLTAHEADAPADTASAPVVALVAPPPVYRSATGERKVVTVLCCALAPRLVGSPRLELDVLHNVIGALYRQMQRAVEQYGGSLQPVMGERFLAIFGFPIAQEDHAQRALMAAFGMHQQSIGLSTLPLPAAADLAISMGLHTGLVAVGGMGGAQDTHLMLVGDTIREVIALQEMAEPGTILCSAATARLTQEMIRLEALTAPPGWPAVGPVYKMLGPRPRRLHLGRYEGRPVSQFVGRTLELATMQSLWSEVIAGQGHVVGMVGDPGIGKSRLLAEFRHTLGDWPVTYIAGRCASYGKNTPYGLVIDLVRHNCGLTESDPPATIVARVQHSLQEVGLGPEAARYLLYLLGVEGEPIPVPGLSAEAIKQRTFEVLWQMCAKGSRQRPLIFEMEDLHWIDATSEEYLTLLVERLPGLPILLLATYRPGHHPSGFDKSYVTQLALRRLSPADSLQMAQMLVQSVQPPDTVVQEIVAKADGNPFFLEELAHVVREQDAPDALAHVPDTVQAVLQARIDHLPGTAKNLLHMAAIIGKEQTFSLLQAVTDQPEETLRQELRHLQAAEFLYEVPLFPVSMYTFKHILTQEVAYGSLLHSTRQQHHERVAQVIVERFPELVETQPELLARHYTEANRQALAVPYWYRAGVRAGTRSACVEAITHLNKGLELLGTLPDTPERTQQELDLQTLLASVLMATRSPVAPEVEHAYARARALCQQVGPTPKLIWVLEGLWAFYLVRGKFQTAWDMGEQILALVPSLPTSMAAVVAHQALGLTAFYRGELLRALEHFAAGLAAYDPQQSRARTVRGVNDPGVMCTAFQALALCLSGYPEQGAQQSHAMLRLAKEVAHPHSLAFAHCAATVMAQCRREEAVVLEHAEAAVTLATAQGFPHWTAMGEVLWGWALAMQGESPTGLRRIRRGLAAWRASGAENLQPYFLTLLADAYAAGGQVDAALQALTEAQMVADNTGERWWQAETYRLRGELLMQTGDRRDGAAVTVALQQARDVAQQQGARLWELRAAMSSSRWLSRQDQRVAARDVLRSIHAWFTEGSTTADLQDARAQLDSLG